MNWNSRKIDFINVNLFYYYFCDDITNVLIANWVMMTTTRHGNSDQLIKSLTFVFVYFILELVHALVQLYRNDFLSKIIEENV